MIDAFISYLKKHYCVLLFLSLYFLFIAWKLIGYPTPFYDWDESIYAQVGREMVSARSLVPLWQGVTWLDKPPLVPLTYGLVLKLFTFVSPEISTRIFTLTLAVIVLIFIYHLYLKALNNRIFAFLVVLLTAFNPIFLQRSQVLNIDIFVLLGWIGYAITFPRFWTSFFFLFIAVMSKSLIGFYPLVLFILYYGYEYLTKKITKKKVIENFQIIFFHGALLSIWFIAMFLIYGHAFWQNQIIEAHFKRVTASIESHFGKRTYYLDLIFEQFGPFTWISFISIGVLIVQFFRRKISTISLFYALYLLPWFVFLNLTKTKIFWYIYPTIPQFAFLVIYPLTLISKKKIVFMSLVTLIIILIFRNTFLTHDLLNVAYSKQEDYLRLAKYAKTKCSNLNVLVDSNTRQTFATLQKLNLLISTSRWWGNHPSIVYYFGKRVIFEYDKNRLIKKVNSFRPGECLSLENNDLDIHPSNNLKLLSSFATYFLYKKL